MFWSHCKRNYSNSIKTCRVCGALKPEYGILDKPISPKPAKSTTSKEKQSRKPRQSRDPLISNDEKKLWVSTLKMRDGRTLDDIKAEKSR